MLGGSSKDDQKNPTLRRRLSTSRSSVKSLDGTDMIKGECLEGKGNRV